MGTTQVEDMTEQEEKYGERRKHDPEFKGPIKNRGCTDVICLLLLLAFLGGWGFVAYFAFTTGNPMVLIYPSNSKGEICGRNNLERADLTERPFLMFFDITKCLSVNSVTGCATKQVCVKSCPAKNLELTTETLAEMKPFCSPEFAEKMSVKDLKDNQICPPWVIESKPLLGRCVPSVKETSKLPSFLPVFGDLKKGVVHLATYMDLRGFGERVLHDLATSWWIILISLIIASIVSFLWIFLMKYFACVMVWTSLVLSVLLSAGSCVYCAFKYIDITNATGNSVDDNFNDLIHIGFTTNLAVYPQLAGFWIVMGIISGLVLLILLIILIFSRKSIKISIEMIDQGAMAVRTMTSTLFFPIVPLFLQVIVVAWFLLVGMYLASSGEQQFKLDLQKCDGGTCKINGKSVFSFFDSCDPNNNATFTCDDTTKCPIEKVDCMFYKYGPTAQANWFQLYNIFGLTWLLFFVSALDEMVMAGAFASWYWTMDKSRTPTLPVLSSFGRTLLYHMGTLAFGSLIIAIIRVIRAMIEYVEQKLKQYHQDNPLVKCCLCCCRCFFWCLESFMKFINRNAYIMTAIYGKNFCSSAKEAFFLLMRNVATVWILDKVTGFLLFMGKLVIVGGVAVTSYYVFSGKIDDGVPNLNYYYVPVIIVTVCTYFIADVFFDVYEMAVDTIFLCFLEDLERNDGSPEKPYYMSKDLKEIMNKKNKENSRSASPQIPLVEQGAKS